MIKNNNPWMASSAYQEADFYKFKGRDEDTQHLLTMLLQNESVICYAASGDGKSSLINAGVCPGLRKNGLFPIKIMFTTAEYEGEGLPKDSEGKIDFDQLIANKINLDIRRNEQFFIEKFHLQEGEYTIAFEKVPKYRNVEIPNSLWWKLRTETIQIPFGEFDYIPVLIFDQFEEIFRAKWKAEFFKWLEVLMRNVCPNNVIAAYDGNIDDLPTNKLFKTLFSMRYEYVGELDYWCSQKTFIPQMMQSRYFLKPLTRKQAISIIDSQDTEDETSKKISDNSTSIVDVICKKEADEEEVSAFILSIVCYEIYEKIMNEPNYIINEDNINHIISSFYDNTIHSIQCDGSDKHIPQKHIKIIENALVDEMGHRLRLPVGIKSLKEIGFEENYRKPLETAHLIRSYNVNDETYVELIHDRLADAVIAKRTIEQERNKKLLNYLKFGILFLTIIGILSGGVWYKQYKWQKYALNGFKNENEKLNAQKGKLTIILSFSGDEQLSVDDYMWDVMVKLKYGETAKLADSIEDKTIVEGRRVNRSRPEIVFYMTPEEYQKFNKQINVEIAGLAVRCIPDTTIYLKTIKHSTDGTVVRYPITIEQKKDLIPIEGCVTYNGKTLGGAIVILNENAKITDSSGNFTFYLEDSSKIDKSELQIVHKYYNFDNIPCKNALNGRILINLTPNSKQTSKAEFYDKINAIRELFDALDYNKKKGLDSLIKETLIRLPEFEVPDITKLHRKGDSKNIICIDYPQKRDSLRALIGYYINEKADTFLLDGVMKKNVEPDTTNKVNKKEDLWVIEATGRNKVYSIVKYYGEYVNKQIHLYEQKNK